MQDALRATARPDPREYLAYYSLVAPPFAPVSDPRGLWLGQSHREALSTLTAAIRRGEGVLVLTGESGSGKTSLVNWLVEMLAGDALIVGRLAPAVFEVPELSAAVAQAFHLEGPFASAAAFAARFRDFLADASARGRKVLLVVDEAERLGDDLLRKVFELSAIGTFEEHPFAILLAGQPELAATIAQERHAGLRARVAASCVLAPLSPDEVGDYIASRLRAAGRGEPLFAPDAVRQIAVISRGAPGVVDVVCEQALAAGCRRGARVIDRDVVEASLGEPAPPAEPAPAVAAAPDLLVPPPRIPRRAPRRAAGRLVTAGVIGAVVVAGGAYAVIARWPPGGWPGASARPAGGVGTSTPRATAPDGAAGAPSASGPAPADVARSPEPSGPTAASPPASGGSSESAPASASAPPSSSAPVASPPASAGDARPATSDQGPVPPPRSAPVARRAERPAPPAAARTETGAREARPAAPTARERAAPRSAPEREHDATDPSGVIDWLLRESGRR